MTLLVELPEPLKQLNGQQVRFIDLPGTGSISEPEVLQTVFDEFSDSNFHCVYLTQVVCRSWG